MPLKDLKIALVCDWLTHIGGAERVIFALHQMFPHAPIYTSVAHPDVRRAFPHADIRPSFLQKIPGASTHHQWLLRFMPYVFEHLDLSEFDMVISSSHSCSKGIITKPQTLHICYCHSPMRYVWDSWQEYVSQYRLPRFFQGFVEWYLHDLRLWDRLAADRVDSYIANSHFVRERIRKYYRHEATVIHPPVDVERFHISHTIDDFFLAVGRLVPYKRFDFLIEVFNQLGLPLKICGDGPQYRSLQSSAKSNIEFLGNVRDEALADLYSRCRALLFPQCEDFGIAPLEAMASGRPVIAYARGGALETVNEGVTGIFFHEQNLASFQEALGKFEKISFHPEKIRSFAEKFSSQHFEQKMIDFIESTWTKWA